MGYEIWTLEQAKLGTIQSRPLDGHVVYITGAASGIGKACVEDFAKNGANVFLVDVNGEMLSKVLEELKKKFKSVKLSGIEVDVTNESLVKRSIDDCIYLFGGVDIIVSNAGKAYQSKIEDTEMIKTSFDINFYSHQYDASNYISYFLKQNLGSLMKNDTPMKNDVPMGGCLLFNVSKSAVNPGPNFGPYAVAKAATLALM